jgi:hypothetical protein
VALMTAYLVTTKNAEAFFNAIQGAKAPERFTTKFLKDGFAVDGEALTPGSITPGSWKTADCRPHGVRNARLYQSTAVLALQTPGLAPMYGCFSSLLAIASLTAEWSRSGPRTRSDLSLEDPVRR